jgi:hypothetical protein
MKGRQVNYKLEVEGSGRDQFKILSHDFPEGTKENYETSFKIAYLRAEI